MQHDIEYYQEKSTEIKALCDLYLYEKGILSSLNAFGKVYEYGSYALDLMVWPDIDLYLEADHPLDHQLLLTLFDKFLKLDDLISLKVNLGMEPSILKKCPTIPQGTYIQLKLSHPDWFSPIKFDIWALDSALIQEKIDWLKKTKKKITPKHKDLILETKFRLMTPEGRSPQFGSYFVYEAILDKGLTDPQDIRQYLTDRRIKLPETDFSGVPWRLKV